MPISKGPIALLDHPSYKPSLSSRYPDHTYALFKCPSAWKRIGCAVLGATAAFLAVLGATSVIAQDKGPGLAIAQGSYAQSGTSFQSFGTFDWVRLAASYVTGPGQVRDADVGIYYNLDQLTKDPGALAQAWERYQRGDWRLAANTESGDFLVASQVNHFFAAETTGKLKAVGIDGVDVYPQGNLAAQGLFAANAWATLPDDAQLIEFLSSVSAQTRRETFESVDAVQLPFAEMLSQDIVDQPALLDALSGAAAEERELVYLGAWTGWINENVADGVSIGFVVPPTDDQPTVPEAEGMKIISWDSTPEIFAR